MIPCKRVRQLQHDLPLRAALEDADDPFQRVRHIGRMHRRQHEMAGFRRGQRG